MICWPLLATLSVLLETTNYLVEDSTTTAMEQTAKTNNAVCSMAVEGFRLCVKFTGRLDLDTERDAFVCSLAKFTYLNSLKEMRQKNLECIKALLDIGLEEGNHLASSWIHVLKCISELERMALIRAKPSSAGGGQSLLYFDGGGAGETESRLTPSTDRTPKTSPDGDDQADHLHSESSARDSEGATRKVGSGMQAIVKLSEEDKMTEFLNSDAIVQQIDPAAIDKLFARTTQLSARGIVDFVTALCQVSADELTFTISILRRG